MQVMSLDHIAHVVGGELVISGDLSNLPTCRGISIDSRSVVKGDLFVAIKGERVDGNDYVPMAMTSGASGALTTQKLDNSIPQVIVDDPVDALGKLANFNRRVVGAKIFGITGSNGKTTSKDMLSSILEQRWRIVKTTGNRNNELGMPLTLLELDDSHQAAVVEMGMRGKGQIAHLAAIAEPELGLVTNVGDTHIELLGSREAIRDAKSELVQALPGDGWAILNGDDALVASMATLTSAKVCTFGLSSLCNVTATDLEDFGQEGHKFVLVADAEGIHHRVPIHVPIPGIHNVLNALGAAAAALCVGIDDEAISEGIASFVPTAMRMQVEAGRMGITILNDVYNASPASMKAALSALTSVAGKRRKVAVLADMLELGSFSSSLHYEVGQTARDSGVELLLTIGERAKYIARGYEEAKTSETPKQVLSFLNHADAIKALLEEVAPDDVILVKGSRGMKMEQVVASLK